MNQNITQIKHFARTNIIGIQTWAQTYWFRTILICIGLYIVFTKDINLQVNMQSNLASVSSAIDQAPNPKAAPVKLKNQSNPVASLTSYFSKEKKAAHWSKELDHLQALFPSNGLSRSEIKTKKAAINQYVKRFAKVSQTEAKKYGIPASIKLAQAILESDAGHKSTAGKANNHLGIKCKKRICKKSHCANFKGDSHKDFYIKYQSAWANFRAHSKLMKSKKYKHLLDLGSNNYKEWAKGLEKAGYSKSTDYDKKLLQIIDALDLFKYDV